MLNPYEVLGVDKYDDDQTVKKAYRQLSKQYHPDNNINNPNKDAAEETFKKIQLAYEEIMHERSLGIGGPNDIRRNSGSYSGGQKRESSAGSGYGQWGSTRTAEKERPDYSGPWGFNGSFRDNAQSSGQNGQEQNASGRENNYEDYREYNNGNSGFSGQTAYSDSFYGRNGEKSTQGNYNTNQNRGSYNSGGYYTGAGKNTTYGSNRNPYSAGGGYYTGGKNFYGNNGNGYTRENNNGSNGSYSNGGYSNGSYSNGNYNNGSYGNNSYDNNDYDNNAGYNNDNGNDQGYNSGSYDNGSYGNENYNETSDNGYYQRDGMDMQTGLNEAAAAINNRDFYRALDILNSITNRNDVWFYYSAIANLALGNNITAMSHAKIAKGMNPNRPEYDELISGMEGGTLQYRGRAGTFVPQKVDKGNICVKLIIANIVLNVVCGGGGFILGPCISC